MRIAFLIRSLNYGGTERQLVTLAKGLKLRGHEISVIVFYSGCPLEIDLKEAEIPVYSLEKRKRWHVATFLITLIRRVRQLRPDVLHSYLVVPDIIVALLRPLLRPAKIVWGVRASNMDLSRYDRFTRITYKAESQLSRLAELIIVNSHAGYDFALKTGFAKDKLTVIPNGIDIERFRPDKTLREETRAAWKVTDEEKLVGVVARFDPMKDHENFLGAAAGMLKKAASQNTVQVDLTALRFVCVGLCEEPRGTQLMDFARQLSIFDKVLWINTIHRPEAAYNALDVACSSSAYGEGFSNSIGEAMACGKICAVTDVGDSALIVGDTRFVSSPADPNALADALIEAVKAAGIKEQNTAVRQRIIDNFSTEKLIENTERALKPFASGLSTPGRQQVENAS